jgi:hypothetical protein
MIPAIRRFAGMPGAGVLYAFFIPAPGKFRKSLCGRPYIGEVRLFWETAMRTAFFHIPVPHSVSLLRSVDLDQQTAPRRAHPEARTSEPAVEDQAERYAESNLGTWLVLIGMLLAGIALKVLMFWPSL